MAIETQSFKFEIATNDSPVGSYVEIKEISGFTGPDGQAAEIETTHLQSTAKEFLMGLQDFGNFNIECNYLPTDSGQVAVRAAKASRAKKTFKATLSSGQTLTFQGYVLNASMSGAVDDKVNVSYNIRITGTVTYS